MTTRKKIIHKGQFLNNNGKIKDKKSRRDQKQCDHNWERVYHIHSWKYQCAQCGACRR